MSSLRSRKIILANSSLILLFVLVQTVAILIISSTTSKKITAVEETYNQKIETIFMMRHIAHDRTLTALSIYVTRDPWLRDDYYMEFSEMAEQFIKARIRLESLHLQDNESVELQKLYTIIRETQPLQVDIVKRILEGEETRVFADLVGKDLPWEERLSKQFVQLINTVNENYRLQRSELNKANTSSMLFGMLVSMMIIVAIFMIVRHVMRKLEHIELNLVEEKEQLSWDAVHDSLTGVYNRRWLLDFFATMPRRHSMTHSLVYIDLDDFKKVNDQYSHEAGDLYLQGVVDQIQTCIRSNDHVIRIGGDEFIVYLNNCFANNACSIAKCILQKLSEFTIEYQGEYIQSRGASIGVTQFASTKADFDRIVREADHAAMIAKQAGKNRIECYQDHGTSTD